MTQRTLPTITPSLSIGDLPGFEASVEIDTRGKRLAELFHDLPDLPGVLLTEQGVARSAVSRRYYLEMIGRYCGRDPTAISAPTSAVPNDSKEGTTARDSSGSNPLPSDSRDRSAQALRAPGVAAV